MKELYRRLFVIGFGIISLTLIGHVSWAQEGIIYPDRSGYYLGAGLGNLLPFKVKDMEEIYPAWGLWFSHPSEISQIEYSVLMANAGGVTFYNAAVGLRIDYEMVKSLEAYFTLGLDGNYFKRKDSNTQIHDFEFSGGSHAGFGVLQRIAVDICFRADFKFGFSPGKTLSINMGLIWEIGDTQSTSNP